MRTAAIPAPATDPAAELAVASVPFPGLHTHPTLSAMITTDANVIPISVQKRAQVTGESLGTPVM